MNMILTIISGLFVLNIVVLVHEYGHYVTAKRAGVYAPTFAIGFGPKIWTFYKNEMTSFELRAIPFGGFVRMASKFEGEELNIPENKKTLEEISKLRQIWIIAAGAIFNFIFAIIAYFIIGLIYGNVETKTAIIGFDNKYEAHKVLKEGDEVIKINGHLIDNPGLVPLYVEKSNKVEVIRKKSHKIFTIKGTLNPTNKKTYLLGIKQAPIKVDHKYGFVAAFNYTYNSFKSVIDMQTATLKMIFGGRVGVSDMSGPVGIVRTTGKVVEQSKGAKEIFISLVNWICLISIAIGLANLMFFFIPVVDGGRIFLIILGIILKRDLSDSKIVEKIMQFFIVLMIIYFVYISFIDLFRHL